MNRALTVWQRTKTFFSVVSGGHWNRWLWGVQEAHTGDWQRNIVTDSRENLLAFSAVYACIALISDDIAKLPCKLKRLVGATWFEVTDKTSPYYRLFQKPNSYQSPIQFFSLWMVLKLMYGNVYVLLERDETQKVVQMYILDSRTVTVLVTEKGDVYYNLRVDYLSGVTERREGALTTVNGTAISGIPIPASEIIHDRMMCLWHPLCGVPPLVACGLTATQGRRIQNNSAKFFENMSRPSGHLSSPDEISDVTAKRLKDEFERNFSGGNIGRLLVTGDGLKYEPFTIPPEQAQLIEQLKWTVEDVARCFKVPPYKLGLSGAQAPLSTIGALNQEYYSQTLQVYIEAIEQLLNLGLDLPNDLDVELDEEGLLRMDPLSRAERAAKEVGAGVLAPNEGRAREGLPPKEGGDTPYLQMQNYSLAALNKRDQQADPFAKPSVPTPTPAPAENELAAAEELAASLIAKFSETTYAES